MSQNAPKPKGAQASRSSARRKAREFVLQAVYAWLLQTRTDDESGQHGIGTIEAHLRDDPAFVQADQQWFNLLWRGVTEQADELRLTFAPYVDRPIQELSPVEHGILLIGTYELQRQVEVPYRVAINEAVELAKSFGGTDGFKFINGVLDKVALQVRPTETSRASMRP